MYFNIGNYNMSGNFTINKAAPMDSRSTVAKLEDLSNPNLFNGFTYKGMIVSVVDDTELKNGVYRLKNKTTLEWKLVGEGTGGGTGTAGDYNTLINKPVFKTINNNNVLGEGNIAIDPVMYNNGIIIRKSYTDIFSFDKKKNLTEWKESDVVYIGEYVEPGIKPTCYLSPVGSDMTGDGSYENPWKTFTKVPKSSIVGLKAGEYRTSGYGRIVTNSGYNETHGLFTGLAFNTQASIVRPFNSKSTLIPSELKRLLSIQSTNFDNYTETMLIIKENDDVDVKIIWDTISPSIGRDKNIITSYMGAANELLIFKGITFIRNTATGLANHSLAICELSYNQKGVLIEDCVFDFGGGGYSLIYGTNGIPIYNRCKFLNGTLTTDYSGSKRLLEDNTINTNEYFLERILPGYRIYNTDVNDFIPFAFLKDGITSSTYTFNGLSEIPSPKLGVETKTAMRHPVSGKPIYTKTIDCGFLPAAAKTAKVVPLGITDAYDYVKVLTDSSHIVIPTIKDFSFSVLMPWYTLESQIGAYIESGSIVIGVGMGQSNKKAYITVEYTKTADTNTTPVALIGGNGKDAYEVYKETTTDTPVKTKKQWLDSLKGKDFTINDFLTDFSINGKHFDSNGNIELEGLSNLSYPKLNEERLTEYRHHVSGKPIYTKTINFGALPSNSTKTVNIDFSMTDDIWIDMSRTYAYRKDTNTSIPLSNNIFISNFYITKTLVSITTLRTDANTYENTYITVEYTKTTDTASSPVRLIAGKGADGKSAYQSAVDNGYTGTEAEWVEEGKGKRGLPGPAGNDGTVAFESLTEAQLEMLLNNRNIITRESINVLLSNTNVNTSILDISSKMSLPEKIRVTTDEDAVYTIENLKLANPLATIGDCRYTNISSDLTFDIFADNSALLVYPLQTNSHDLGGLYNGVDTGVTYANNKAVFNGAAKITPPAFTIPTEMTVSFYVTFTELGSFMLFDFGGGKAIYMYQDNRIRAQYSNANNAHKSTTSAMVVGREYFVTAIIKAASADIYIDGELQTNTAWANYVTSVGLCIGAKPNNIMFSKMNLSMVRVFNRALSASEIKHMYDTRTVEMLELYHASGVKLKDAKIIQRTVTLNVPRYLNEGEAMKYGLQPGDMYYLTDGSVKYVKGL